MTRPQLVTAAAALAVLTAQLSAGAPPARGDDAPAVPAPTPTRSAATWASWTPEYSSFLVLGQTEDLIELELADGVLWLVTESIASRLSDGVWSPVEPVSDGDIMALAPVGSTGEAWAFGYEGAARHRVDGRWRAVESPTTADLYDAAARGPADVWAVGFDYDSGSGVVVRYDGARLSATTRPWLVQQQLLAVEVDGAGEMWAGGCNGNDRPFMMRDRGIGAWEPVVLPDVAGCLEHISFAPGGAALAAVHGDLLWREGDVWRSFGQPPPVGYSWVRVAVLDGPATIAPDGWAVPGTPTWRGYIDGQTPWRRSDGTWQPAAVDYRGYDDMFAPNEDNPDPRPFLDLVGDGVRTWSVSRSGGQIQVLDRVAAVLGLEGDRARIAHPLVLGPVARTYGDVAVLPDGTVWAGAQFGAAPFVRRGPGGWSVAPGPDFEGETGFSIYTIDMAAPDVGWATGGSLSSPGSTVAWRIDGKLETWTRVTPPARTGAPQVRALPDGGAWSQDWRGRLVSFDGSGWQVVQGAPALTVPAGDRAEQRAPFDVVAAADGTLRAWAASADRLHAYGGRAWAAAQRTPRGQVLDLQMLDESHGWAIARDTGPVGASRVAGVLLRLGDGRWTEVDLSEAVRDLGAGGRLGQAFELRRLEWQLMAPVDASVVWLVGVARATALRPFLVRVAVEDESGAVIDIAFFPNCDPTAISAVGAGDASEIWMLGTDVCGPAPPGVAASFRGPLGRLSLRAPAAALFLPALQALH